MCHRTWPKITFSSRVIVNSQKVSKKCIGRSWAPFPQFPPMLTTLYKYTVSKLRWILAQCIYSFFRFYQLYMYMHEFVYNSVVLSHVALYSYHHNQNSQLCYHCRIFYPFIAIIINWLTTINQFYISIIILFMNVT